MGEEWRKGWHPEDGAARIGQDTFDRRAGHRSGRRRIWGLRGYTVSNRGRLASSGAARAAREAACRLGVWIRGEGLPHQSTPKDEYVEMLRGSAVTRDEDG